MSSHPCRSRNDTCQFYRFRQYPLHVLSHSDLCAQIGVSPLLAFPLPKVNRLPRSIMIYLQLVQDTQASFTRIHMMTVLSFCESSGHGPSHSSPRVWVMCKHGLPMRALMEWDCHTAAPARVFFVVDNGGRAPPVCGVVVAVCRTHSCGELRPSRVAMASRGLDIPVQPRLFTNTVHGWCRRMHTRTHSNTSSRELRAD